MKKKKHDIFNHEFLPHIDALYNFEYRLTLHEDDTKNLKKTDYQDVENYSHFDGEEGYIVADLQIESLQNMVGDEVSNALNTLNADPRIIIILCDLENFQYDEIAKILAIPIGMVGRRLHQARNLLKQKLYDYSEKNEVPKKLTYESSK